MKNNFKKMAVAIAATMTIGSISLVSCDKESSGITTESQITSEDVVPATKKKFKVDIHIKDSQGRTWHIKGWVDCSLTGIKAYDIEVIDPDGKKIIFKGEVKSLPNGGYNVGGTLTDEMGNVIIMTQDIEQVLIELTEFIQANY